MLLAVYKEMTEKLSLIDVTANKLCFVGDERSRLFHHFLPKWPVFPLWIAPNIVFVDASMVHLIAIILQIFREKKLAWFGNKLRKKTC